MGPMWTLLLSEHLISEWCGAKLVAENKHQKDRCYDVIGPDMCSKFRHDGSTCSIINTFGSARVII